MQTVKAVILLALGVLLTLAMLRWERIERSYDYMENEQRIHVDVVTKVAEFCGMTSWSTVRYEFFGRNFRWFDGLQMIGIKENPEPFDAEDFVFVDIDHKVGVGTIRDFTVTMFKNEEK